MDKNHSKLEQEQLLSEISDSIGRQVQNVMERENDTVREKEEQASEEKQPEGSHIEGQEPEEVQIEGQEPEEVQPEEVQKEEMRPEGESENDAVSGETVMEENTEDTPPVKKKMSTRKKVLLGIAGTFAVLAIALVIFVNYELNQINYETRADVTYATSTGTATPAPTPEPINKDVINILLIGEESIHDGDGNGRSDSMMIATINCEQKTLKLTSLMRDIYVDIPGYGKNKLNAAFHNGGGFLTMDTIEQNFDVDLDGYVRVDFDAFETIVDKLGGVEIELTSSEAYYLNRTNYISDPASRNVREGSQVLNGSQALGYCRVRYQTASDGEHDDFGRTYRQRTVLKAIFDKYKTKNPVEMVSIGTDLLPYVTTNLTKSQLISYLTTAASFGTMELETLRIPVDGSHYGDKDYCGSVRRYVLKIDYDINNAAIQEFIYGTSPEPETTSGGAVTTSGD
ncbi:MAG: LCP family protein [Clostridiales bacterium]|nr:LCP family protein [Clostridiales bacterium]